jgi:hypothetical protein
MRTTGKAAFGRVRPRHEALGSDSAMRVAPGSEQTFGRRGETTGARDGLTLRPQGAGDPRNGGHLRAFRDVEPNQMRTRANGSRGTPGNPSS